jgi:hypothetical protein
MMSRAERTRERIAYQRVYFAKEIARREEYHRKREEYLRNRNAGRVEENSRVKKVNKNRHVSSDPGERVLYLPVMRHFMVLYVVFFIGYAFFMLVHPVGGYGGRRVLIYILCVCIGLLQLALMRDRRMRMKYRRLYRYERGRRISADDSFLTLQKQFDAEISELGDLVSSLSVQEESPDRDRPGELTQEQLYYYIKGLMHGKRIVDAERDAGQASEPVEQTSGRPGKRHLKLVGSSNDEAS